MWWAEEVPTLPFLFPIKGSGDIQFVHMYPPEASIFELIHTVLANAHHWRPIRVTADFQACTLDPLTRAMRFHAPYIVVPNLYCSVLCALSHVVVSHGSFHNHWLIAAPIFGPRHLKKRGWFTWRYPQRDLRDGWVIWFGSLSLIFFFCQIGAGHCKNIFLDEENLPSNYVVFAPITAKLPAAS